MSTSVRYDPELKAILERAGDYFRRREKGEFERLLLEAVRRQPQRLDLHLCLVNHFIQVCVSAKALETLEAIVRRFPRDVDALFLLAHWRRHQGDAAGAERVRETLAAVRPEKAADLAVIWRYIDAWLAMPVTDRIPPHNPAVRTAVVTLGYKLAPDGTMQRALVDRLEKTLEAASIYPEAIIVVTGGVPQGGRVEAVEMRRWLVERGVDAGRIREEGYARDIVENLLFSRPILDAEGAGRVVAVTAAGNVRRTGASFGIVAWTCGSTWSVKVVAASGDTFDDFRDDREDLLKLYRDALRSYGVPMMAAYPELSER